MSQEREGDLDLSSIGGGGRKIPEAAQAARCLPGSVLPKKGVE